MEDWVKKRVLIVVRTYPVPATKGIEVSCTAAVTEDGQWAWIEPDVERLVILQWIDPPDLSDRSPADLLTGAASRFQEFTLDAID